MKQHHRVGRLTGENTISDQERPISRALESTGSETLLVHTYTHFAIINNQWRIVVGTSLDAIFT